MIDTYLFDINGTIVDNEIYKRTYPEVMDMISRKTGYSQQKIEAESILAGLKRFEDGRFDSAEICEMWNSFDEYYQILESAIDPNPETLDTVLCVFEDLISKGKEIGITTNSFPRTAELYIWKYNIRINLSFVYTTF